MRLRRAVYALAALFCMGEAFAQPSQTLLLSGPTPADATKQILHDLTPLRQQDLLEALTQQSDLLTRERQSIAQNLRTGRLPQADAQRASTRTAAAQEQIEGAKILVSFGAAASAGDNKDILSQQLEVVRFVSRPVWALCDGEPWIPADRQQFSEVVAPWISNIKTISGSIGLISIYDKLPSGQLQLHGHGATGYVIGAEKRYVLTNRHVVRELVGYKDGSTWKLYSRTQTKIAFPIEYRVCARRRATQEFTITKILYVDEELDFALLETDGNLPPAIPLSTKDLPYGGERIAVIGYPSRPGDFDTFLTPAQIDQVFKTPDNRTPFPILRIAAGAALENTTVEDGYFSYDATTWSGNSGSVVMSLVDGTVVGLHARGRFGKTEGTGYNDGVSVRRILAKIGGL